METLCLQIFGKDRFSSGLLQTVIWNRLYSCGIGCSWKTPQKRTVLALASIKSWGRGSTLEPSEDTTHVLSVGPLDETWFFSLAVSCLHRQWTFSWSPQMGPTCLFRPKKLKQRTHFNMLSKYYWAMSAVVFKFAFLKGSSVLQRD